MLVYQSLPAPPMTAAWLRQALEPVIAACKFEKPIPIEIRPTGMWGGWCDAADFAPDGRVCISSKVVFWTGDRLKKVMLHEAAHRLLEGKEIEVHGPEFFALIAIFHTRAKLFFKDEALNLLSIYDLQDVADIDKGHVFNWALALAVSGGVKAHKDGGQSTVLR